MLIRKVETNECEKLIQLYSNMIIELLKFKAAAGWIMEVYPTSAFLKEQIKLGNCYVAIIDDVFVGAMIVNDDYNEGYEKAVWQIDAKAGEFASLHLLGVMPQYHNRGIAIALTNKAIEVARNQDFKALRLDVIDGNQAARKLYEKCGFKYIQDLSLYYDNCGLVNFYLYEYLF